MRARAHTRAIHIALAAACALATALAATTGTGTAASSSVNVTLSVGSLSTIGAGGCASNTAGITAFGTVLPNTPAVTTSDCIVTFGSTNDTSMLRMYQVDGGGNAMWQPATGALDQLFDGDTGPGNGLVQLNPTAGKDEIWSAAVQADGRIVAAGQTNDSQTIVARFMPDGKLDTSFNGTGTRVFATNNPDGANVSVLSDGRIMVSASPGGSTHFILRLNPNGSDDNSWAGDGSYNGDLWPGWSNEWASILPQPDGKVIVYGLVSNAVGVGQWGIGRLKADGTVDTSFSGDGFDVQTMDGGWRGISGALLEADGDIVVAGQGIGSVITVMRYKPDGTLDPTFTGDGKQDIDPSGGNTNSTALLQLLADGSYAIAGTYDVCFCGDQRFYFTKMLTNGTIDNTFGASGKRLVDVAPGVAESIGGFMVMPDGSWMAAGDAVTSGTDTSAVTLRVTSTGAIDTTFGGGDGIDVQDIFPTANDVASALVLGRDGKPVALGSANARASISLIGYDAAVVTDYANGSADWDTAATTSMFGACLRQLALGATAATWTVDTDNTCNATDLDQWKPIPSDALAGTAKIAQAAGGAPTSGEVRLRFGARPASNQPPGSYVAPVVFEVVAPNA